MKPMCWSLRSIARRVFFFLVWVGMAALSPPGIIAGNFYGGTSPANVPWSGGKMGHSFGFTHENIRPDATNFISVLTNQIVNEPANIVWFTIDPTSITNGNSDYESVMHLGWDFDSIQPGALATQQPKPPFFPRYEFRMGNFTLSPGDRAALAYLVVD